jgi:hypothetical protein
MLHSRPCTLKCWTLLESSLPQPTIARKSKSKSKSHCDCQSISKSWCRAPSGAHDQIFITLWQLRSWFVGAPSLTRGRVCLLYMLLALASVVFLGSESLGTRDRILLSQIWDFPARKWPLLFLIFLRHGPTENTSRGLYPLLCDVTA